MRPFSGVLLRALATALTLCLASVTATAVANSGQGDAGNGASTTARDNSGNGNANTTPVTTRPSTGTAAPATPPSGATGSGPSAPAAPADPARKTTPAATTDRRTTPADGAAPTPVPPAAAPVIGKSMGLEPASGTVQVRLPGATGYVSLGAAGSVPSGAVVDTRAGTVQLQSAIDATGRTQTATIRGAVFEVRQSATGNGLTELVLKSGRPQGCAAAGSAALARAAMAQGTAKRKQDRLWVRDNHGRFRTRGRNSVASVRGTRWSTRETCAGTLTRVMVGAVDVYDLREHRTVSVRAGHTYLARTSR